MPKYVCFAKPDELPFEAAWYEVVEEDRGKCWAVQLYNGQHTHALGTRMQIMASESDAAEYDFIRTEHDELPEYVYVDLAKRALVSRG